MLRRVAQLREAGRPPQEADFALARQWLSPELLPFFERQHPRDIAHSAATARWLLERGHHLPDLIVAALLHDFAKGPQRRVDRVAWVVANWLWISGIVADVSSRLEIRRAMGRSSLHAASSASIARDAGVSERCALLIARHHQPAEGDPLLDLLQRADAAN